MGYESASDLLKELESYSEKLKNEVEEFAGLSSLLKERLPIIEEHLDKTNTYEAFIVNLINMADVDSIESYEEENEALESKARPIYDIIERIVEYEEFVNNSNNNIEDKKVEIGELEKACQSLEEKKNRLTDEIKALSDEKKELEIEISHISQKLSDIEKNLKNKETDLAYKQRNEIDKTIKDHEIDLAYRQQDDIEKAYGQRLNQADSENDKIIKPTSEKQVKQKAKKDNSLDQNKSEDSKGIDSSGYFIPKTPEPGTLYLCDNQGFIKIKKSMDLRSNDFTKISPKNDKAKYKSLGNPQFRLLLENGKWFALSQQYKENIINGYSLSAEGKLELANKDIIKVKDKNGNSFSFCFIIG